MFKVISAVFLIALGAVANGAIQNLAAYNYETNYNSSFRIDVYINMNRNLYANNILNYDTQQELFTQSYSASLDTINIRQDMLIDTIVATDNKLNPLEILSDLSQKCVSKYRSSIPTVPTTKTKINNCVSTASNQLDSMLSNPKNTRYYLNNYYMNTFESSIAKCNKTHYASPLNHTLCVTDVVDAANTYTISNQETFATQMDAAQCTAKANIKKALDCSYSVESETNSAIGEAISLINKCLLGQDDCKQCNLANSCSELSYMKRSDVSYTSRTMDNLFYGRSDIKNCLMIKIY